MLLPLNNTVVVNHDLLTKYSLGHYLNYLKNIQPR